MSIPAHIKYLVLTLLFTVAIINTTRTTLKILDSSKRLNSIEKEVISLKDDKKTLENDIAYKNTEEYVEEKARNELNMAKPGEELFIAPKAINDPLDTQVLGDAAKNPETNFQMWVDLFF